jgi:hypothetical protein
MPVSKLAAALGAVSWTGNISSLLADSAAAEKLALSNLRLATWARQFEIADNGNPALCFIREMQISGQNVAVLIALSLYKPAAASMRGALEAVLYYSYFRTHPSELETLARRTGFYLDKNEIFEYHKEHTIDFTKFQQKFGLVSRLGEWYARISAITHGQIPGEWVEHTSVADIKAIKSTQDTVIDSFTDGVEIIHFFLLCTAGRQLWQVFSTQAKRQLLKGLPGDIRKALELDLA